MKIYVADRGDTLSKLSSHFQIAMEQLLASNPHITNPFMDLSGLHINLSSTSERNLVNRINAAFCPPVHEQFFMPHWIPLTPIKQMAATEYDVLVVGSGAGGGAALWRLSQQLEHAGKRIGIIEKGDLFLPTHAANIATINGDNFRLYAPPQITDPIGNRLPQFPGMKLVYALGGRTLLWGAISPRMAALELANWPVPLEEMETYYNIAEEVMNVTTSYTKGSSITQILLQRLRDNGFHTADDIPIAADLDETRYGKLHANVFFSSIVFLAKALSHRAFDLAVNSYVTEVVTDGGRTIGVRVMTPDMESYFIKAKHVILSASALQTPRILLNSKIPGKAIGHYLINHSYLIATANVSTLGFYEPLGALGIIIPESPGHPYQLQLQGPEQFFNYQYEKKPVKDDWHISFFGASGRVESRYENKVYIDPSRQDRYGVPDIQVDFSYSTRDDAIIRQMYSAIERASTAMQLRLATLKGSLAICLMPPGGDNHEAGTCRMGDDPSTSATNQYGQIHGISGLYIADNSVLPSMGAVNPTLTTVALAIRTADYICKQML
ncbi:GMC oxidoreductase [Paenibacillus silvestris]|nr:GMC oxidoreductase [Paenibacillus silvestris]